MKSVVAALGTILASASAHAQPAAAQTRPPFQHTLSNTVPLAFGMDADTAARALNATLTYLEGKPGDEIFLAYRRVGGTGFFDRKDRLYLQFRGGRLAGWKGDWGRNWMWR